MSSEPTIPFLLPCLILTGEQEDGVKGDSSGVLEGEKELLEFKSKVLAAVVVVVVEVGELIKGIAIG